MKIFYVFIFLLISSSLVHRILTGSGKVALMKPVMAFPGLMGNSIDYVLELQTTGSNVSGFSYTYFNEGPKRYYTICKLTGTVNNSQKK